jgi:hypothetical protein
MNAKALMLPGQRTLTAVKLFKTYKVLALSSAFQSISALSPLLALATAEFGTSNFHEQFFSLS